jgi:apolipoprotein N-acyltransferase
MPPPLEVTRPWADRLLDLAPWPRRLTLVAAGAAAALALPPTHVVPLLWVAFPVLLGLLGRADTWRRAFATGWWFGLGHFALGLYWVAEAFLVDPWRHGWMIPFALSALGAGMGLFVGLSTLLAHGLAPRRPVARALALAAAWTAVEWLRSWLFTGFPWNLMGTVWMPLDGMLQSAAWIGAYGLSLVTVAAAGLPVLTLEGRRGVTVPLAGIAALAALAGAGAMRLPHGAAATEPGVRLRLVQPAIEQSLKWADGMRVDHVRRQIDLSRSAGFEGITHVIWAETAVPFYLDADANARNAVAMAAPPGGVLIAGAPRRTPLGASPLELWNSLFVIDGQGRIVASYDKVHLVPFGEYMPLRALLPPSIEKLTAGSIDFSGGTARTTLQVPGAPPVDPLVCYEIIFPDEVVGAGQRPGWIVNLTNDGWFGISSGPYQHFAAARLRAVEQGVPVVRVANTGISAVVDGYGRVVTQLGLGREGFIDSDLPAALQPTPYARWGALIPLILAALVAALAVAVEHMSGRSPAK